MPALPQTLPPYETRLSAAVAEVRQAIEEQKPYRVMDTAFRHSVRFNELQEEVRKVKSHIYAVK